MADITKVTLAKEKDTGTEYYYPSSSSDIITHQVKDTNEYTTVKAKLDSLEDLIGDGTTNNNYTEEIIDARTSRCDNTVEYDLKTRIDKDFDALNAMLKPRKIAIACSANSFSYDGSGIYFKIADGTLENNEKISLTFNVTNQQDNCALLLLNIVNQDNEIQKEYSSIQVLYGIGYIIGNDDTFILNIHENTWELYYNILYEYTANDKILFEIIYEYGTNIENADYILYSNLDYVRLNDITTTEDSMMKAEFIYPQYGREKNTIVGKSSTAIGSDNNASGMYSTAIGRENSSTGSYSFTHGYNNEASNQGTIAIGENNIASGEYSFAIGEGNTSNTKKSIAIGYRNNYSNDNAIDIDYDSTDSGIYSSVIGTNNIASGPFSSAIGIGNNAVSPLSFAAGIGNTINQYAKKSIALGTNNTIIYKNSIVLGHDNSLNNSSEGALAIGLNNEVAGYFPFVVGEGNNIHCYASNILGRNNKASNTMGIVNIIGNSNNAENINSTNCNIFGSYNIIQCASYGSNYISTVGNYNKALGEYAFAIGNGKSATQETIYNRATANYAYAIGTINTASGAYSVAIGYNNTSSGESSIAIGTQGIYNSTTKINSATKKASIALGQSNTSSGISACAIGCNNTASGQNAIAFGYTNSASGSSSTSIGYTNTVSGQNAIALGYTNRVYKTSAIAIGNSNNVGTGTSSTANNACAIGYTNTINGESTFAFGHDNTISNKYSYIIGNNNTIKTDSSLVIGINNTYSIAVATNNTSPITLGAYNGYINTGIKIGNNNNSSGAITLGNKNIGSGIVIGDENNGSNITIGNNNKGPSFGISNSVNFEHDLALGYSNTLNGDYSYALGHGNKVYLNYSIAIGYNNTGTPVETTDPDDDSNTITIWNGIANESIAMGYENKIYKETSIAIGKSNYCMDSNAITIGIDNRSDGGCSIAFGNTDHSDGEYSLAIGNGNSSTGEASNTIGRNNNAYGKYSIALGALNYCNTFINTEDPNSDIGEGSITIGVSNKADENYSIAIGKSNESEHNKSISIGVENKSNSNNSIQIGVLCNTEDLNVDNENDDSMVPSSAIAIGYWAYANARGSAAIGTAIKNYNAGSFACGIANKRRPADERTSVYEDTGGDAFTVGNGYYDTLGASGFSFNTQNAFRVATNGTAYASNYNSTGADYAEFVKEWYDGNIDNEDRVGYMVTVKNGKLYKANEGDYIIGITSGNPSVIGNADEDYYWKFERDRFNRIVLETKEIDIPKFDNSGNQLLDESNNPITEKVTVTRRKVSSDYDPSKEYVERLKRPEWDYVGMRGIVPCRDDGTCEEGGFCKCGNNGIATKAETRGFDTYYVIERIDEETISVEVR